MAPDRTAIDAFHHELFAWWETNRRDLPWRHTRNPYAVLVSELMLQQTQVARVVPKYLAFLAAYPDAAALAAAPAGDVIRMWKGLGYNRRALFLKRTAEAVVSRFGGLFPRAEADLLSLPGIGKYTARAVMVFAYEADVAMVDTNVRRIIVNRFFGGVTPGERAVQAVADLLVPPGNSWAWHQALMDYGALALPRDRTRTAAAGSPGVPFVRTVRYLRGRIVDALRETPYRESDLVSALSASCNRQPQEVEKVIGDLVRDGLVVVSGGMASLP
jgi:A/G-specific adenine glycosylase